MANLKTRYVTVTRAAKEAIKQRQEEPRSREEQRVFDAFRKQAKAAYSMLKPVADSRHPVSRSAR